MKMRIAKMVYAFQPNAHFSYITSNSISLLLLDIIFLLENPLPVLIVL